MNMVQYYTLQEAAAKLHVSPDELREMAKNGEVRAFQDRGNMRFRAAEVDELSRLRGFGSDPDLQLGDATNARQSSAPTPRPNASAPVPEVFDFTLGNDGSDEVSLGQDLNPSGSATRSGARKSEQPKTGVAKTPSPASPNPKSSALKSPHPPTGDSDVRLVSDGSGLDFQIELDHGLPQPEQKSPSSHRSTPSSRKLKSDPLDSGVRIVPLDQATDSDVKMVPDDPTGSSASSSVARKRGTPTSSSDSDIRIERDTRRPKRNEPVITEEIDLDAETRRAEQSGHSSSSQTRTGPKSKQTRVGMPAPSPFELAEPDINVSPPSKSGVGKSGVRSPAPKKEVADTSEEFEIAPTSSRVGGSKSPAPKPAAEDIPMLMGDEDVKLGELTGAGSGINLKDPADSGISLEQSDSDEVEFDLSLDSGKTPHPGSEFPATAGKPSSNEFELSLDSSSDSGSMSDSDSDSDSEFELSLDASDHSSKKVEGIDSDSDSEFELALDETGDLSPASDSGSESSDDKDIFETDFEAPALEEGSGSEAVALEEGDLDSSSDFELDLNEKSSDGTTASQVVALDDEEEFDEGAETVAKPRRSKPARAAALAEDEEAEGGDLDEDLEGDLEDSPEAVRRPAAVAAPAAEWGVLPGIVLIPCVIILFLASLMCFELIQGLWGFHRGGSVSGPVTHAIANMFGAELPKE